MNNQTAIVNLIFTLDASPPTIPMKMLTLDGKLDKRTFDLYDLDIDYYNRTGQNNYDMMQYLIGGFPFTYPFRAEVDSNYYPVETLLMANLIVALLYDCNIESEVQEICKMLKFEYDESLRIVQQFNLYLISRSKELAKYKKCIFICESLSSVYTGMILAKKIKEMGSNTEIEVIGKNILIPDIFKLSNELKIIDGYHENIEGFLEKNHIDDKEEYDFDFSAINLEEYPQQFGLYSTYVSFSSGCPGRCDFCSIRLSWNKKEIKDNFIYNRIDNIIDRIKNMYETMGSCFVHIEDCTLNSGSAHSEYILEELSKIDMMYSCNLRADRLTDDFIHRLKKANIVKAIVGVESINEKTVRLLNKGTESYVEKAKDGVKNLIDAGIQTQMNVLLFHPYEKVSDVEEGIKKWEEYFKYLDKNTCGKFSAPVGTLCINYPSKMYFDVLNDATFQVNYHRLSCDLKSAVPDNVVEVVERIPKDIIRKDQDIIIDKMDKVKEIYALTKGKKDNVESYINKIIDMSDLILKSWIINKLIIVGSEKLANLNSKNKRLKVMAEIVSNREVGIEEVSRKLQSDSKLIVSMIMLLEREKIIFFKK